MIRVHVAHGSAGRRLDAELGVTSVAQKTRYGKVGAEYLATAGIAHI